MAFEELLHRRRTEARLYVARALEENFTDPSSSARRDIDAFRADVIAALEQEAFKSRKRQADAQRSLAQKFTKTAEKELGIATRKIADLRKRLTALNRIPLIGEDSRIFPFWHAPLIVQLGDRRWVKPMRYHCRQADKPASIDKEKDGLYNARRDNLTRFWRSQFGATHALMVVSSFYENVKRHRYEHRALQPGEKEQNVVLHYDPKPADPMIVACLWSHWEGPDAPPLDSFCAITDEPPPEIAATGHDRCIISIRPENIADWLSPSSVSEARLQAILTDKQTPFYEHETDVAA